jgi:probable rRNA maturation factor
MISFFEEDLKLFLKERRKVKTWLGEIAQKEGFEIQELNYIFCSDDFLLNINNDFLQHDDYTDIITFDMRENQKEPHIEGEIYISLERIKENAAEWQSALQEELRRVMVHGLLHLCGYKDKSPSQKKEMREKENQALSLF